MDLTQIAPSDLPAFFAGLLDAANGVAFDETEALPWQDGHLAFHTLKDASSPPRVPRWDAASSLASMTIENNEGVL